MAAAGALGISIEQVVVAALYAYSPRYTGPLEYLTMWMCLFLGPAVLERLHALAGTGAGLDTCAGHSGQAVRGTGHSSTCVGCAAAHGEPT